ncbi:DNA replication/repair protein RecF [Halomonas sp. WWR20]
MPLDRLNLLGLRNLKGLEMRPGRSINLISGANGSGKTSILEGIHLLGLARSFRTRQIKNAIAHDAEAMTLHGRLAGEPAITIGLRRQRSASELEIRLAGEKAARAAQLADAMPLQLVNPDAFRLLEGAPASRREFLDWGTFHVKRDFFESWKSVKRALKHRNALLRHDRIDAQSLQVWERELAHWGTRLDALRSEYMAEFVPVFEETLAELLAMPHLSLRYYRGWDRHRELAEVLQAGRDTDRQMGFTQLGPQRADLRIRIDRRAAVEVLSRGQQKLVVSAMKLAQGRLLEMLTGRTCIYLIDDLPAELDAAHRRVFCHWLERQHCQVFITSVDIESVADIWQRETDVTMFHVKHGRLHTE